MAGFVNHAKVADAYANGRFHAASFRKAPTATQLSVANWWTDLSGYPGNPVPNYYAAAPTTAKTLDDYDGIFHGDDKSPATKYLTELNLATPSAALVGEFKLLDYVMYYPFVDLDDTSLQTMTNIVTLPRYTTGAGLMAMLVAQAPTVGGGSFSFTYYNQDGVLKTAPTQSFSTAAGNIGNLVCSQPATEAQGRPFLLLDSGDYGIRSIVSWTNVAGTGGLGAVVLVKVLATIATREVNTAVEMSWPNMQAGMPVVYDGAYLNLICRCASSVASSTLSGRANFIWSE